MFRLVAMGEDTPLNIELFLGPRCNDSKAKVLPIYQDIRTLIIMAERDRVKAQCYFQNWDELT